MFYNHYSIFEYICRKQTNQLIFEQYEKRDFGCAESQIYGGQRRNLGQDSRQVGEDCDNSGTGCNRSRGVTFQQVLESYGDSRATEAQQTAVSNYEKKHGLKDGKQVKGGASAEHNDEPDNQHGNGDNDTPAWAKAIIDGQKSLSDRLAAIEGDKVTASRKQKFDAIIGKLPEDLRKPYARTDIKSISDEEFDTLLSEVGTEVEELAKTANARGAVFGRPATGGATKTTTNGVKEATDEEAQRVVDGMNIG